MLTAVDVSYAVGTTRILNTVSIDARAGELLAIVGPNGAGKSTLLKLLTGDIQPTQGRVSMSGRSLREWRKRDAARCRAVVSQSTSLSFPFRVFEVVLMGRAPHAGHTSAARDTQIAVEAMRLVDAEHLADRVFPTLSGGEQQRVMLARALTQIWDAETFNTDRYLILDEPTSNLDIAHQHSTLSVARRFAVQDATVVAVLHDFNLAALYADRIAILKDGEVVEIGAPWEALKADILESVFRMPVRIERHPSADKPMVVPLMGTPEKIVSGAV